MVAWPRCRRRDQKGMAAVEFAMLLPVMITMFFGVVESPWRCCAAPMSR